jgi:hypothetical protein
LIFVVLRHIWWYFIGLGTVSASRIIRERCYMINKATLPVGLAQFDLLERRNIHLICEFLDSSTPDRLLSTGKHLKQRAVNY